MTIPKNPPQTDLSDLLFHVPEGTLNISPAFAAAVDSFCKKSGLDKPPDAGVRAAEKIENDIIAKMSLTQNSPLPPKAVKKVKDALEELFNKVEPPIITENSIEVQMGDNLIEFPAAEFVPVACAKPKKPEVPQR